MAVNKELVLVTGATGFIGFRTLVETLKAGYRVRAAVRNQGGIEKIKKAASIQAYLNQLEFVLVPDILNEDAYHEAVVNVDYIIHLASPTTKLEREPSTEEEMEEMLIQPAVKGTMNMIKAASKYSPTTKRMVVTSSVLAIIEWSELYMESGKVFNEQSRTESIKGPFGGIFPAYARGKVAALNFTEEYVRTQRLHFDINHIGPSFTVGKDELATTRAEILAGTNGAALGHVVGAAREMKTPSSSVFVNDVARMHVLALDSKVAGGQFFLGVSEGSNTRWEEAFDIVRKHFPEAVESGIFPLNGENATKRFIVDNEYTKKVLGIEFAGFEEQVKSVAEQYLALEN